MLARLLGFTRIRLSLLCSLYLPYAAAVGSNFVC